MSEMETNLENIVAGYSSLIGRKYVSEDNEIFTFLGILYAEEDIYYVMSHDDSNRQTWISCVMDLDSCGYSLDVPNDRK